MAGFHAIARAAAVMAIVLCATPAQAQAKPEGAAGTTRIPLNLRVMLASEAALHSLDMVTTVHGLRLGAVEANPLLAPLSGRPAALVTASTAINVLQIYGITKLHARHPKVAVAWALILAGAEAYAVTNNIKTAGQLQRARAGRR